MKMFLVLLTAFTAFAQVPSDLIVEEQENQATEAQMKPGLERMQELCAKFPNKNPGNTSEVCRCVAQAVKTQKSMTLIKNSHDFYSTGLEAMSAPAREFLLISHSQCRANPQWKTADPQDDAEAPEIPDINRLREELYEEMTKSN